MATVSRLDDINSKRNNVSCGSNKPPGWEWDTIKGRGYLRTGDRKRGKPPTNTNITSITDPKLHNKLYGVYEHLWSNFSKPPWNNNNKTNTNTEHIYIAKEEQ